MRKLVQVISWLAIVGTILPSVLYLFESITLEQCKWAMLLATIVWFVATPLWMGRAKKASSHGAADSA